jgi:hypothetical protein
MRHVPSQMSMMWPPQIDALGLERLGNEIAAGHLPVDQEFGWTPSEKRH